MVLLTSGLLAGCGAEPAAPPPPAAAPASAAPPVSAGPMPHTAADGRGAIRPLARPTDCTATVTNAAALAPALAAANPGNRICVFGDLGSTQVSITRSGTPRAPITIEGDGSTSVDGIDVRADWVTVSGLNVIHPHAPGVSLHGNDISMMNTTVVKPRGDDGDGVRFWGSNLTLVHNTIQHTRNAHHAHADCMQTFATDPDSPASQYIVIQSNRCEDISNTCLIMEGPHSLAGDGSGVGATSDVRYDNNFCDNRASQALQIDDVQHMTITNNDIAGHLNHAFALQNMSTDAKISGNTLDPDVGYQVGMDDTSRPGYQGPAPGGEP